MSHRMSLSSLLCTFRSARWSPVNAGPAPRKTRRPVLERLEDRLAPALNVPQPVSVDPTLTSMSNGPSTTVPGSVSANGQFAVFSSNADNLVTGLPTSGNMNVYRRDLLNNQTTLVSINSGGSAGGSGGSEYAVITPDGRYVAFVSTANNLTGQTQGNNNAQVYVRDMTLGQTLLVSADQSGSFGNQPSNPGSPPSISETSDGRLIVAYHGNATNLVPANTSSKRQVFFTAFTLGAGGAIQAATRATTLVSADASGNGGNDVSSDPVVSKDGSTLVFTTDATNLNVPGGYIDNGTGNHNLVQYSLATQTLRMLTVEPTTGTAATGDAESYTVPGAISGNGRYAVFTSASINLVANLPVISQSNVFRRDRVTGTTEMVSIDPNGTQSASGSHPAITSDGRYVAFLSASSSLGSDAGGTQVYVRDMTLGQTVQVSASADGHGANGGLLIVDYLPAITVTADGRLTVAYLSSATNLTANQTSTKQQVYVTRLNLDPSTGAILTNTRVNTLASADASGTGNGADGACNSVVLSKDGTAVAFYSTATNLPNENYGGNGSTQLYVYSLTSSTLTQISPSAIFSTPQLPSISDDGQSVAYNYSPNVNVSQIRAWRAGTSQTTLIAEVASFSYKSLKGAVLSGDGTTLAFVGSVTSVSIRDEVYVSRNWQSGSPTVAAVSSSAGAQQWWAAEQPSLSTDGHIIAYAWDNDATSSTAPPYVYVTNLDTGVSQQVAPFTFNDSLMVSADGSTVLFDSRGKDVATGVVNFVVGQRNVYAYTVGGASSLVSAKAPGLFVTNGPAFAPALSDNGRYLVFDSGANDLLGNVADNAGNVFAIDLQQGLPVVISVTLTGDTVAFGTVDNSSPPVISADGSIIAFQSSNSNFVSVTGSISGRQIYSRNWLAANPVTTLVSINAAGTNGGQGNSSLPSISADGKIIAFQSTATNLVTNDAAGGSQVFVRKLPSSETILLSSTSAGTNGGNAASDTAVLSSNGKVVVFNSKASDLVAGVAVPVPTGGAKNVYATSVAPPPPNVTMTAPAGGSISSNNLPTLAASATDNSATGLANVQFQISTDGGTTWTNAGAPDTSDPYAFTFITALADGTYKARAIATDNVDDQTTSAAVSFTIDTGAPTTVAMTSPANNSLLATSTPTLIANVADNSGGSGIANVQFQISSDGGATWTNAGAPDTLFQYLYTFDTPLADGSYQSRAVATDLAGNTTTSAAVTFTLDNVVPTITGINPTRGPTAGGTIVTISGSNFAHVTQVKFSGFSAQSFTINPNGTQITATSPFRFAGASHVTVTSVAGTSAETAADVFTYLSPLTLGALFPTSVTVNQAYTATLGANGGSGSYSYALQQGSSLPSGLNLSSAGVISGSVALPGSYAFTVVATDTAIGGLSGTKQYTLTVNAANTLTLTPDTLTPGALGSTYGPVTISATGGFGNYTYKATGLPAWLTLTSAGALSGRPTVAGTFAFTVTATDATHPTLTGSLRYSLVVNPALTILPVALPQTAVGANYSVQLSATGGSRTNYAFSATGLPAGLTLSASGLLTGIPTTVAPVASPARFTVTVTDSNGSAASKAYSLVVNTASPSVTVTPAGPVVLGSGERMTAAATLANAYLPGGTVTFALLSPTGTIAYSEVVPVSGTGTYRTTNGFLPTVAGVHRWIARYSGDAVNKLAVNPATTGQELVVGRGVSVVGNSLYLVGGNTNDRVQVLPYRTSATGSTGIQVSSVLNGVAASVPYLQSFASVSIYGFGGDDAIQVARSLTVNFVVVEGDGDNHIQLGQGHNTVTLGNGDNALQVGNGNNVVVAGSGSNSLLAGNGNNLIAAGLGEHVVVAGTGTNILIDGRVQLNQSGDTLRKVLDDWTQFGSDAANVADIRSRLAVTYNSANANILLARTGLDWFWSTFAGDLTNPKQTDLLN